MGRVHQEEDPKVTVSPFIANTTWLKCQLKYLPVWVSPVTKSMAGKRNLMTFLEVFEALIWLDKQHYYYTG